MIFPGFFTEEINRFERALAMLAYKVVQCDASVGEDLLDAKSTLFPVSTWHYFGSKRHLHLRAGPDVVPGS